jgi:hypothetical protein
VRAMKRADEAVAAWVAAVLSAAASLTALWLALTVPSLLEPASQLERLLFIVWSLAFAPIGLLILTRRSGNRIGWATLGMAFVISANSITTDLSTVFGGRGTTLGLTLDLLSGLGWLVWISMFCWFLLLFPDGHLPSRRWRPLGWVLAVWPPLYLITAGLAPQSVSGGAPAPNPFMTIGGAVGEFLNLALKVLGYGVPLVLIGALVAAIVRFRHARGSERQQLKWLAYWAAMLVAGLILDSVAHNPATTAFINLAILGLPITVAIAIFRYRLYDIDLLIKRTFVYGATSAAIAATFYLGIVALQGLLRPVTLGSELPVAASTLVSFALFQPIRRRVQGAVDQRFDRSRYDAAKTVDAFADLLRDEVDLDALRAELLGAVSRTMSPTHASIWLKDRPE